MTVPRIFLGMQARYANGLQITDFGTVVVADREVFQLRWPDGRISPLLGAKFYDPAANRENFLRAVDEWVLPNQSDLELASDEHVAKVLEDYQPYKEALKEMFRALSSNDKYFLTRVVDVVTTSVPK